MKNMNNIILSEKSIIQNNTIYLHNKVIFIYEQGRKKQKNDNIGIRLAELRPKLFF